MAKKKTRKKQTSSFFDSEITLYVYSLLMIALSIIGILEVGIVGQYLTQGVQYLVGNMFGIFYGLVIILAIILMKDKTLKEIGMKYVIGCTILFLAWLILCAIPSDEKMVGMKVLNYFTSNTKAIMAGELSCGGGIIGAALYSVSSLLFERLGTYIMVGFLILLGLLLIVSRDTMSKVKDFFVHKKDGMREHNKERKAQKQQRKVKKRLEKEEQLQQQQLSFIDYDEIPQEEIEEPVFEEVVAEDYADLLGDKRVRRKNSTFIDIEDVSTHEEDVLKVNDVTGEIIEDKAEPVVKKTIAKNENNEVRTKFVTDFKNYRLPTIRLLNPQDKKTRSSLNTSTASEKGKQLVYILGQFGVNVTLVDTHIGPSVTKFELRPEQGVRVNKISNLQQDIKMGLAAKDIRIEAPIPGKSTVGIEIPNEEKMIVSMRDLMRNIPSGKEEHKLLFALGKDLMGNCVYGELNKMPHLLIAGATGSGKSVCVNSIISSVLMRTKPDEVKMLLIDPKKVEFTQYVNIPHLIAPVITNGEEASRALKVVVKIMEDRYELFSQLGVRNISGYNGYLKTHPQEQLQPMPFIMVVIDELADLMLVAAKEVESSIQRITQLARAAGIHLIVATQRPSVDVITGVIKANIPSRIAFAVSSAIDSRTILDQQGAEKLLGLGDMLYVPIGEQVATRVQGCFVSDEEVNAICQYCANQALPKYDDIFLRLDEVDSQSAPINEFNDPLYEEVKNFVIESGKASTSFIQRKFSIGYSRAARLIDMLEAQGIIGPSRGSKPREVYVHNEEYDN